MRYWPMVVAIYASPWVRLASSRQLAARVYPESKCHCRLDLIGADRGQLEVGGQLERLRVIDLPGVYLDGSGAHVLHDVVRQLGRMQMDHLRLREPRPLQGGVRDNVQTHPVFGPREQQRSHDAWAQAPHVS